MGGEGVGCGVFGGWEVGGLVGVLEQNRSLSWGGGGGGEGGGGI